MGDEIEISAKLIEILRRMAGVISGESKVCVHCGKEFERLEKHGRCVYAYPCGCRQYQGELPNKAGE